MRRTPTAKSLDRPIPSGPITSGPITGGPVTGGPAELRWSANWALSLVPALLVGLAVGASPLAAMADDSKVQRSKLPQGTYSIGQQGNKLKWLPHRPSKPRDGGQVVPASYVSTAISLAQAQAGQVQTGRGLPPSPSKDPFGDLQSQSMPVPPRERYDDHPFVEESKEETDSSDTFPNFLPGEPEQKAIETPAVTPDVGPIADPSPR